MDEKLDGLLIHSENSQALNLINDKYNGKIDCVYIDPPYNTDASKIIYKNNYEHSTWISMMYSRVIQGKKLLSRKGIQTTAIDEYELSKLYRILIDIFGREIFFCRITLANTRKCRIASIIPSRQWILFIDIWARFRAC